MSSEPQAGQDAAPNSGPSRRATLKAAAAGAATLAVAACARAAPPHELASTRSASGVASAETSAPATSPAGSAPATSAASTAASGSRGPVLAKLSDIGVGSAVSATGTDGGDIIISRTGASAVKAFSAVCPHQGCTVAATFSCPCHGSQFDPTTGARISGPAPTGLSSIPVTVQGGNVVAG